MKSKRNNNKLSIRRKKGKKDGAGLRNRVLKNVVSSVGDGITFIGGKVYQCFGGTCSPLKEENGTDSEKEPLLNKGKDEDTILEESLKELGRKQSAIKSLSSSIAANATKSATDNVETKKQLETIYNEIRQTAEKYKPQLLETNIFNSEAAFGDYLNRIKVTDGKRKKIKSKSRRKSVRKNIKSRRKSVRKNNSRRSERKKIK